MGAKPRKPAREVIIRVFLESLKSDPNVSLACDMAGISRTVAYIWKKEDEAFADAWEAALERTRDVARSSIYQRGILGWDEPVVSMGQAVYEYEPVLDEHGEQKFDAKGKPLMKRGKPLTIHKWSDSLASLYAKANLPEYKEKPQVNINAQLADLAEQAKNDLLADLEASLINEDKDPSHK